MDDNTGRPCPHGDPTCPCRAGGFCHYKSDDWLPARRCPRTGTSDCTACLTVVGETPGTAPLARFTLSQNLLGDPLPVGWMERIAAHTPPGQEAEFAERMRRVDSLQRPPADKLASVRLRQRAVVSLGDTPSCRFCLVNPVDDPGMLACDDCLSGRADADDYDGMGTA